MSQRTKSDSDSSVFAHSTLHCDIRVRGYSFIAQSLFKIEVNMFMNKSGINPCEDKFKIMIKQFLFATLILLR